MSQKLDFDGRVALVTGAGRGVGRSYAELLAARGAKIVVNDLGTATGGGGVDDSRARDAVAAIVESGGIAVGDASDISTVEGAAIAVQRALDSFGRLDIVVNNAGIFAVDAFPDVEVDALRQMFEVHVAGGFNVTRAAWPHLVESGSGRVVFTTSTSALGAANTLAYGTAKMGVLGLARATAQAGVSVNIKVNLVAPLAMTRMMAAGMGLDREVSDLPAERSPALVAPLVAILCHESCPTTGEVYVSGMGRVARVVLAGSPGYTHPSTELTPEDIVDHWDQIFSVADSRVLTDPLSWSAGTGEQI